MSTTVRSLNKLNEDAVLKEDAQTIAGIKTFSSFPVTPSAAPTADYQTANKKYVDDSISPVLSTDNFLHIQDQETTATQGGTSSTGANIRVLNTVVTNTISGASLTSNQITLPIGTFYVEASAPGVGGAGSQLRLLNVTDASEDITGVNSYSAANTSNNVALSGIVTIAASKVFNLTHWITTGVATNGLGNTCGDGSAQHETYAEIKIWKVG